MNTNDPDLDAELAALRRELRVTIIQGAIGLAFVAALFAAGFIAAAH